MSFWAFMDRNFGGLFFAAVILIWVLLAGFGAGCISCEFGPRGTIFRLGVPLNVDAGTEGGAP